MSYIGAEPTTAAFPFDQFSGNGTTTAFTLTYAPASTTSIIVAISGVVQNPNLYSVIGTTITFSPAPPTGTNNISVLYLGLPVQIGTPIPGSRLELALGSAANPSLTFLGDTNTGIFSPAADTIAFTEGGTEVARFDSSGNFGVGTSSPDEKLTVTSTNPTGGLIASLRNNGASSLTGSKLWFNQNTVDNWNIGQPAGVNAFVFCNSTGSTNERMRIDSSGNLLVGTTTFPTSTVSSSGLGLFVESGSGSGRINSGKTASGTFTSLANYHAGTYVGGINYSNTATSLLTSSDERLKENITAAPPALEKAMSIEVVSYDWKHDPTHVEFGLVAQRLNSIYSEAVYVGDDGEEVEKTWGVEYGRLTPMLLKAIQELKAELDATKAEVALLKGAA